MVGLYGITGIPEPASVTPAAGHDKKVSESAGTPVQDLDQYSFSPEAQDALTVARLLEEAKAESEVREERIAKAQEQIEQGTYRLQQVVLIVAARVSKYVAE